MARSTKIKSKIIAQDSVEFSALTAETVPVLDENKNIVSSVVTPEELANLSGTTSPLQEQLDDENDRVTILEDNSKVLKVYAYENNSQIFADGQPGIKDPSALIRDGWYFKNDVAGEKINWYYFDGLNQGTVTLGELDSMYAVMTFDSISAPIIAVYTFPTGTGDVIPGFAHSRVVYDGVMTPTPTVGKKYLVYGGTEPTVHPELPRIQLAIVPSQSIGERLPSEQVLTISFGSASGAAVNQVQFMVETLGLFSTAIKQEMDLRIRVASQLDLNTHVDSTDNPHSVTKDQVGLGDVDNTSDADKPISDDVQAALDLITDINWTGDYDNEVTYNVGDGVMFNGASFRMISFIGAAGYPPSSYPENWLQVTDYFPALDNKVSIDGDTMTGDLIISNEAGGTNTVTPDGQFIVGGDLTTEYARMGYYINWTPAGSTIQKISDGGFGYLTLNEFDSSTNASKTIDIQLSGISMNESLDGSPATPIMPTNDDHVVVKKYVDNNFVSTTGDTMTGSLLVESGTNSTIITATSVSVTDNEPIATQVELSKQHLTFNLPDGTNSYYSEITANHITIQHDTETGIIRTQIEPEIISLYTAVSGVGYVPAIPTQPENVVVKKYVDDNFVSTTGDTMTGQLTLKDTSLLIDGTITQGYPSTVEISTNFIGINDNNGIDVKETSISAGSIALAKTSVDSSNIDTTLVVGVDGTLINSTTTDYANQIESQLTITTQSVGISSYDEVTEISKNTVFGTDGFVLQATNPDTSYVLIEASSQGISATSFDTTTVTPLMPTLPEHYAVKQYVDNLVSGGGTDVLEKFQAMKEPTGFINRTSSITSFNDLTREFTIQPTAASYEVYVQATKFIKSSVETITIDNASGNHYIFFNSVGVLSSTQVLNADLFQNNALISIIYWNTDTSTHTYFAEERHGLSMDGATHSYLHTVFGARYLSGLALEGFISDGTGNFDSNAIFYSDSGSIRDEDLLITILSQSNIPVLYRQGVLWRKKTADMFPLIYSGTTGYTGTRVPFNELIGGNWQLTEIANNAFVLVHLFATNDKENPIIAIQGIAEYGNVTAARLAASTEITSLSGLPFAEFVALGSVVFESSDSYTNTPKARVRSVNGGDYVDFRGTQLYTPAGEPTTHSLLSNLSSDDHLQYHTDARGDVRYYTKSQVDLLINASKSAGDIAETEVSLSNFQTSPQNITGFTFSNTVVRGFSALVTVEINATSDLFEQFTLNGIQKNGSWNMSIESIGDNTDIVFSITSSGQIQYTSPAYDGFTSADVKFRAITTSF
jgi:hypothetical protein